MNFPRTWILTPLAVLALCAVAPAATFQFGSGSNQFSMDFVPIGYAGNASDTTGAPNPVGAVPYNYLMGTYEVSADMLIKADTLGGLNIEYYSWGANKPVTEISWNEAARFANWLNASLGYTPAYKFAFQPGQPGYDSNANILLWSPGDLGFNAANPFRNSLAHFFLPSVDEWYKAAYYDPNQGGPGVGGYWNYPTGSDTLPTSVASGTAPGTVVAGQLFENGPADIHLAGGLSPLGTMAQGGNTLEWMENEYDLLNNSPSGLREYRGGRFASPASATVNTFRSSGTPFDDNDLGFRVAAVPEPTSMAMAAMALASLAWLRSRRATARVPA